MVQWKLLVLGSLATHWIAEAYINTRQISALKIEELPLQIHSIIDKTTITKSLACKSDQLKAELVRSLSRLLISLAFIQLNWYAKLWDLSGLVTYSILGEVARNSISQAVVCLILLKIIEVFIKVPFEFYERFVVEEKHGFNNQTVKTFCTDIMKMFVIGTTIGCFFIAGLLKTIQITGDSFPIYTTGFITLFYCVVLSIVPIVVFPWVFKLTPLDNGPLKEAITKLAEEHGFPSKEIYVCDGSVRTSHSNAFFTGMPWSKLIVIYDTLIENASVDEILGVLAHELGHWKNHDMVKLIALGVASSLIGLYFFSMVYKTPSFYESFGFYKVYPTYIGFIIFEDFTKVFDLLIHLAENIITRAIEYNADNFAARLGYQLSLKNALIKLGRNNLSTTNTDWLYSTYFQNHPDLSERLEALDQFYKEK